jgi:hypothetical protein
MDRHNIRAVIWLLCILLCAQKATIPSAAEDTHCHHLFDTQLFLSPKHVPHRKPGYDSYTQNHNLTIAGSSCSKWPFCQQ